MLWGPQWYLSFLGQLDGRDPQSKMLDAEGEVSARGMGSGLLLDNDLNSLVG